MTPPSRLSVGDALSGVTRLGIDTAPFIYFVEKHPAYYPTCHAVFERIGKAEVQGYTSLLTLTETLPQPLRNDDAVLVATYRALLLTTPGIVARTIDNAVATAAADLRARVTA